MGRASNASKGLPVKTDAQRAADYRTRRRAAGFAEADKERDRQRHREARKRLSHVSSIEKKRKEASRKKACRDLQKAAGSMHENIANPYQNPQTLGKGIARARRALPQCPIKRLAVVKALAEECGLKFIESLDSVEQRHSNGLEEGVIKSVLDLYRSNEVSWQSPNKRDLKIIRTTDENGKVKKTCVPKRYLLMSLKEVDDLFEKENPECTVSFSKFHSLKPVEIETFSHIPHEVCLCTLHENIKLLLKALHTRTGIPIGYREFLENVTCDQEKEDCMTGRCNACRDMLRGFNPANFIDRPETEPIVLEQWEKIDKKMMKVGSPCNVAYCFKKLEESAPRFKLHVWTKRVQAKLFQQSFLGASEKEVVMQIDFVIAQQNEVQSGHWSHEQCTLFTAHVWAGSYSQGYVIVSNCLTHGKVAVYRYLDILISDIQNFTEVEKLKVFSDGAASQFKQRYVLSLLPVFSQQYGIQMSWNFFATSHGKGVVDGHGGSTKGAVWRRIRCGEKVKSAKDFAEVAKNACHNLKIMYECEEHILEYEEALIEHWRDVLPTPNLQRVETAGTNHLAVKVYDGAPLTLFVSIYK